MDTHGVSLDPTDHALRTILSKGFTTEQVRHAFEHPCEVYPSRSHPGQWRVCGDGVCLVGVFNDGTFRLITVYADRIVTPVRLDQLKTPEGRRFAEHGRKHG